MPTNIHIQILKHLLPLAVFVVLSSCVAPPQFEAAEVVQDGAVTDPRVRYSLAELPFPDSWTRLTLTGSDAGFTHVNVLPGDSADEFVLRSEAYLQLFLLGTKTTIIITSTDWVTQNLRLKRFHYDYLIDGVKSVVAGTVSDGELRVSTIDDDGTSEETLSLQRPIYPGRASFIYPVLHGLETGKSYSYLTYDGETGKIKTVVQRVAGYGRTDSIEGNAYQILSNISGSPSDIWIDPQGRAVLEVSMKGLLLAKRLDSRAGESSAG